MNQIEILENVGAFINKNVLPTVARLCLISTFLEDSLRLLFDWGTYRDFVDTTWGCGQFLGNIFVLINLVCQLPACVMVLLRKKVDVACGMFFFCMVLQMVVYLVLWDKCFMLRHLSLLGALLFVLAEARTEDVDGLLTSATSEDHYKLKSYMQLTGRILLVMMYITILRFDSAMVLIFQDLIGGIMMALVVIGYRTKLSALMLVLLLTFIDLYHNEWWATHKAEQRNFLKYDFFQMLSVIGGLLMLVYLGPGDVSLDEGKKKL